MQKHTVKGWIQLARPPVGAQKYEKIEFEESIKFALDAIDKQVPKKPIYRWTGDETVVECPCCEKYPFDLSEYEWARKFCGNCGQAIDWSEVE